jgi:hypothetical protein
VSGPALAACACVALLASAAARAQDGGGVPDGDDDDELFTRRSTADAGVADAPFDELLDAAESATEVGGRMHLALTYFVFESADVVRFPWTSPSFLELYVDARPSDRVRAFAQARVDYDFSVQAGGTDLLGRPTRPVDVRLDQLFASFDLWRVAFLTLGRQHVRWGAGRIWNPTDFLNQETRDSLDVVDRRLGVDMIKLHVPFEALRWNNYVIVSLGEALAPATAGVAARSEIAFWTTEISASAAARLDEPLRVGADVSTGLWILDFKAELAFLYGTQQAFWRGAFEPERGLKPELVRRDDELFFRGDVGIEAEIPYAYGDAAIFGVEYFYNGLGYDDPDILPWLILVGDYDPLYTGRHYGALYVAFVDPFALEDVSFSLTNVANLGDLSFLSRLDVRTTFLTHLELGAFATAHYGRAGELHLALDVPPQADLPAVPDGLHVPRQLLDVGGTLTVRF